MEFFLHFFAAFSASFMFLFFLFWKFRPVIKIAKVIGCGPDPTDPSRMAYTFKIVNKSRWRAFDCHVELMESTVINPKGTDASKSNLRNKPVEFESPAHYSYVAKFIKNKKKYPEEHAQAAYALQFRTIADLPAILDSERTKLVLQVIIKHGISGLPDVFTEYFDPGAIRKGSFQEGDAYEIVPPPDRTSAATSVPTTNNP